MYVNRNKQSDDRCRLEFDRAEIDPNLYLDEDMNYVDGLIRKHSLESDIAPNPSTSDQVSYKPIFDKEPALKIVVNPQDRSDDRSEFASVR